MLCLSLCLYLEAQNIAGRNGNVHKYPLHLIYHCSLHTAATVSEIEHLGIVRIQQCFIRYTQRDPGREQERESVCRLQLNIYHPALVSNSWDEETTLVSAVMNTAAVNRCIWGQWAGAVHSAPQQHHTREQQQERLLSVTGFYFSFASNIRLYIYCIKSDTFSLHSQKLQICFTTKLHRTTERNNCKITLR